MLTSWCEEDNELSDWKWHELNNGNRIKASKIARVQERLKQRHEEYFKKYNYTYFWY